MQSREWLCGNAVDQKGLAMSFVLEIQFSDKYKSLFYHAMLRFLLSSLSN